jgi:beta-glucosidase
MDAHQVTDLLSAMTLEEKVSLLAGIDNWHTHPVPSAGIPPMRVSDGPAGARGTSFTGPDSANIPSGTALAASWDPDLIEELGHLLGKETRSKGARVLLAPTVNLHRTPVGGRNFECQSEDPYLSARITVGYVRGVQAEGVAACVKHFVGNDTEFERMTIDNQIDERTLREVYLRPFEAAVKDAGALAIMTAYNRINGPYAADSKELITDILRNEWGFDGIVMSDWFGLHSTVEGVEAGLDLEMPGPARVRGQKLVAAVRNGLVDEALVDAAAARMIRFMDRIGALADGGPGPEVTRDEPEDRALIRRAGSAGMVLLKNDNNALPLSMESVKSVSIIGPNAAKGRIMGGGSAMVNPVHEVHPLEPLTKRFADAHVAVHHTVGCQIFRTLPSPEPRLVNDSVIEYFVSDEQLANNGTPELTVPFERFHQFWQDNVSPTLTLKRFAARITTTFTPDISGLWSFGLTSAGDASFSIDGNLLFDNVNAPNGQSFFGLGKEQVVQTAPLVAGHSYIITIEYRNNEEGLIRGLTIGAAPPILADQVLEATKVAATTDVAILIVGTNDDWESEGYDRASIDLPGRQDELIREVAKVSPRTIVVVNAGSPVAMPWLNDVDAVLFVWFPGQEFGHALTDVIFGDVEPGGRLPVTFPRRLEDTPASEHHPGRNGVGRYLEGRLMGYRFYDKTGRDPLFAFGHGLSYTNVAITGAQTQSTGETLGVSVDLRNDDTRPGHAVVQVYAHSDSHPDSRPDDADQELVGFAKIAVPANSSTTVTVPLDPRWAAHWDIETHNWVVRPGGRELRIGTSSRNIAVVLPVSV